MKNTNTQLVVVCGHLDEGGNVDEVQQAENTRHRQRHTTDNTEVRHHALKILCAPTNTHDAIELLVLSFHVLILQGWE